MFHGGGEALGYEKAQNLGIPHKEKCSVKNGSSGSKNYFIRKDWVMSKKSMDNFEG